MKNQGGFTLPFWVVGGGFFLTTILLIFPFKSEKIEKKAEERYDILYCFLDSFSDMAALFKPFCKHVYCSIGFYKLFTKMINEMEYGLHHFLYYSTINLY